MTDRELFKMALNELERLCRTFSYPPDILYDTINALRARLAQPEPEPVAWKDAPTKIYLQICDDVDCDLSFEAHDDVSWCQDKINDCDVAYVRADTAPPKKEWQGLTDDEIENCFEMSMFGTCRAIEAKLKEKNGH